MAYVLNVATFGVKPTSTYPPARSHQLPYSSVMDNPNRTCQDFRGGLVKGGAMLFSKRCDRSVSPLVESRLAFSTREDGDRESGVEVRYISDTRIAIYERIDPKTHPRVRAPKRAKVIRRILYWKRRYPTIPAMLRKRDINGAFKLLPMSIRRLTHVGLQFSNYTILYISLYFRWKPPPATRGVISSLLLQFVSPIRTFSTQRNGAGWICGV